jgi:RHS repeat-associated protein
VKAGITTTYTWDAFDEMTAVGAVTNAYDALGRLRSRTDTGGTTNFGYSAGGTDPVAVGSDVIARLPGGGQLSVSDTTGSWFSSRDRHGDVTSRYTPTGTVTGSTAYNPFGETTTSTGSRLGGGLGFQGDWTDPSTGLVNQGTRWYQPTTGAFASRDSYNGRLDSPVSLNRYTYGANNPLRYFDPDGRQSLDQALAGVLFGPEANSPVRAASFNYSIDFYRATERARETEALYNLAQFRIDIMSFAGMVGGGSFNPNNDAVINSAAHAIVSINQSTFDNAAHNNALDGNIAKSDFEKISKTASAPLKFAADILLANNNKYDQDKPDQLIGWRAWETKPKQDWLERNWKTIVVIGVGILAGAACGAAGPVVAAMCGGAASRFTGSMLNGGGFVSSLGAAFNPKALATDAVIGWATAGLANAAGNGIKTLQAGRAARAAGSVVDDIDDIARVSSANATSTAPIESGNYVVSTPRGEYVGQSGNISNRLDQHVASGKFTQAEVDAAQRISVPGSKLDREIAEQLLIDSKGGVPNLINVVNPIGPKRFGVMPNQPYVR